MFDGKNQKPSERVNKFYNTFSIIIYTYEIEEFEN